MAISERTYTFRAPADLGDRIREASRRLCELAAGERPDVADRIAKEMSRILARRGGVGGTALAGDNQSAFLREMVEIVVQAAEKVASDDAWEQAYREYQQSRPPAEIAEDEARAAWSRAAAVERIREHGTE